LAKLGAASQIRSIERCFLASGKIGTYKSPIDGGEQVYIIASEARGEVPVAVLQLHGELDRSNYQSVIDRAREAYDAGVRDLLLDLEYVPFTGSSGLVALHSIALLMRGETPPDPEARWGALRSMNGESEPGLQGHVKLLSPQPKVEKVLKMAGFDRFFEIHTDQEEAIASF
jgi:anti-anti-sigma regulatory factor